MDIEFRPPRNIEELASIFKLRQFVYSEDENLHRMIRPENSLDINAYDICAWHFGAFKSGIAIACIRFVVEERTAQSHWTEQLLEDAEMEVSEKSYRFPFQHYYPDKNWSKEFLDQLKGKNIGEVGKLAVLNSKDTGENLFQSFITAFLIFSRDDLRVDSGFGICSLVLERFYRRFGFYIAEDAQPFVTDDLPKALVLRFDPQEQMSE